MAGTDSVGSVSSSASSARQIASVPSSSRWIFTQEELMNTPSIREGMHPEEELKRRRAAAQTIHQMADRLNHDSRVRISQLCICAAMMHMHRFFVFHSFYKFDPRDIAAACLFLAGKSEECPRKLEHIVRVWWAIKFPHTPNLEASRYHDAAQLIVTLENVILQTIAFDLSVDIPHTFVLNHMQNFARGSRKISEIAYWFASDMLHMTNWGVRFPARSIACVCIHLACLWAQFEIQMPPGSPPWYETVDPTMTANRLLELGEEFSHIYKTYGEQLNIKKYAMRNSVANASQASQGQVRRNSQSQSQSQAPSSSLASLPPPPPAPELNSGAVKVETKTEPARRIDLSDYKQRTAGGITASTSAQNASQSSGQRRNFMQPDVIQSAAIVKASGDFDLPLPPAIANEKKTLVAPPEQEVRQKRRADEPERENIKHRRVEKSEKAPLPEGQSSQHRKRTHERTATNVHHEGTPVATNAQHEGTPVARPSGHHSVPGGYSSANSGTSSSSRHHEGGPSSAKKPKQAPPLAPLVPPPPPPTGASSQPPAPAQRISSSLSSSASQPRSSSHGTESSHRSSGTSSSLTHETYSSTGVSSMSTPLASSGHRHSSTVASSSRIKSSRECVPSAASLEMANGGHSSSVTHAYSKRPPRPTTPPLPPPASIQPNRNVTTPSTHQSASYSNHDDSRRAPMEVDGGWVTFCNRFNNRGGHRGSFGGGGGCYRGGYRGSSFRSGSGYYRGGNRPPQNFSRLDHSYSRSDRFEQQSTSPLFGGRAHRFRRWSNGFGPGVFSSAFEDPPQECRFNALSGFGSSSDGNTSRMLSALPPPPPPPPNDELEDGEVL